MSTSLIIFTKNYVFNLSIGQSSVLLSHKKQRNFNIPIKYDEKFDKGKKKRAVLSASGLQFF